MSDHVLPISMEEIQKHADTTERKIVITIHSGNSFKVEEGDKYCDELCWDEMLGTIASLTHPRIGEARYAMHTAKEWADREERFQQRIRDNQ